MDTTEERVISIVKSNIERRYEVKPESRLTEDLGVDSLSVLIIINELEDEFSITIDEDDSLKMKTVSDIVERLRLKYLGK
jgi:acyl carrier protein